MVFYNVICASKEDGGPNLDTLDYISEDVDIRNLDWCTFVWDCLKDTKKPKTYYCGSVTLLMLIYLYCTKCDEGADANREDQEINAVADMFEDIDDPTAKKTNDEDQVVEEVVEETVVALPYKLINKLNKLLLSIKTLFTNYGKVSQIKHKTRGNQPEAKRLTNTPYLNHVVRQFQRLGMDHNSLIYFQFVYRHGIHGLYDEKILEKLVLAYGRLNMAKGGATSIVSVGLKLGLMSPSLCTHVGRCLALNGEAQEAAYFYPPHNE
ncbi:hypothetical protein Tco_1117310 [Tanacetum coccineum]